MITVKVSSKGQILIPKTLCEACFIAPGTELAIYVTDGEIRLKTIHSPITPTTVAAGRGLLAAPNRTALTDEDIRQRIVARLKAQDTATKSSE